MHKTIKLLQQVSLGPYYSDVAQHCNAACYDKKAAKNCPVSINDAFCGRVMNTEQLQPKKYLDNQHSQLLA